MKPVIAENISKHFKSNAALQHISFEVDEAELFGLIGPDGAGKTTLFRILNTLLIPTEGIASVMGKDTISGYKYIRNHVGYMPGRFSLYEDLSVEENLNFYATIFQTSIKENYYLIEKIYKQIAPFKNRKAGKLSGGMKQKLALSCALIHKPKVLFLDEPTTGVDAVSRKEFWSMLKDLKQHGITILVSTPYMDEAELCDRVALMQSGRIMDIDKPSGIVSKFNHRLFAVYPENIYEALQLLKTSPITHTAQIFGQSIHWVPKENFSKTEIQNFMHANNLNYKVDYPNIEDCFMEMM